MYPPLSTPELELFLLHTSDGERLRRQRILSAGDQQQFRSWVSGLRLPSVARWNHVVQALFARAST
ncbi:MAG: hypothetical protein ACFB6S_17545 [Geminicoccaceae bacterium]